ncbi:MAG: hypothetical protein EON55_05540 [Alphaproteobacteria bacterium]|nr:MAG: hypothetical protein EON55_05540 [Alphaproteobacteria bacterium]
MVSSSVAVGELVYAVLVSIVATGLTLTASRLAGINQDFRPAWAARFFKPAVGIVRETWPLTMALAAALRRRRRITAAITRRTFDPGESGSALDQGRRALVTVAISLSPASLVLERDVDCRTLTIASIAVSEPAIVDRRWPL